MLLSSRDPRHGKDRANLSEEKEKCLLCTSHMSTQSASKMSCQWRKFWGIGGLLRPSYHQQNFLSEIVDYIHVDVHFSYLDRNNSGKNI